MMSLIKIESFKFNFIFIHLMFSKQMFLFYEYNFTNIENIFYEYFLGTYRKPFFSSIIINEHRQRLTSFPHVIRYSDISFPFFIYLFKKIKICTQVVVRIYNSVSKYIFFNLFLYSTFVFLYFSIFKGLVYIFSQFQLL